MHSQPLPRIACFHGSGSNGSIYQIQCLRLQMLLESEFEFVFFDAPFERDAGPGVLPWFEEYAPFKSWIMKREGGTGEEIADGTDGRLGSENGVERAKRLMREAGGGGEWIAVMGFSQGTKMAGGLLKDQEKRKKEGVREGDGFDLKFGVLCMGSGAPIEGPTKDARYVANDA